MKKQKIKYTEYPCIKCNKNPCKKPDECYCYKNKCTGSPDEKCPNAKAMNFIRDTYEQNYGGQCITFNEYIKRRNTPWKTA